ncbi:GtrA family protein [Nakamurella deserti]|uniref:GtrA family protein n=1 Tax=Nakamurella deserti TaxID=2164074 RepID=UPI000DBE8506|nr:GtrA family protein [Nakamurella deserti]
MTLDDFPDSGERITPPAGMTGDAGPLLRLIRDQRVAFLLVGGANTAIGFAWFVLFEHLVGDTLGYMVALLFAHIAAVLCAFVLYRTFVFRVRGHVLRDLARFEVVQLTALGINVVFLPLLKEVVGLPVLLAQLIVTAGTVLMSFFAHRGFSFRRSAADREAPVTATDDDAPAPAADDRSPR